MQSLFVVFEGIDGSGKTTQARRLAEALSIRGRRVHTTFEPTNGPAGTLLRQYLEKRLNLDKRSLPYLFAADRSDHVYNVQNGIEKSINEGVDVICDRYVLSSFAYQSAEGPFELIESLNRFFPAPDVTFFLRVDPAHGLAAKRHQSAYADVYDTVDQQTAIALQFERAILHFRNKYNIVTLDAHSMGIDDCAAIVLKKTLEVASAKI